MLILLQFSAKEHIMFDLQRGKIFDSLLEVFQEVLIFVALVFRWNTTSQCPKTFQETVTLSHATLCTTYSSFQSKKKLSHVIRLSPTNGRFM